MIRQLKNKKGQALVEFVIIMPIFLIIILGVIDIGKILYSKIILEEQISDVVMLYQDGKNKDEINQKLDLDSISLNIDEEGEYIKFSLIKKIDIITPGLNFVFDNPYKLEINRSISNDL